MSRKLNALALASILVTTIFASGVAEAKPLDAKPLARHKAWTASPAQVAAAKRRLDLAGTASIAPPARPAKRCSDISCLQYMNLMGVGF